ncbi:MAG: chloride channel protein [Sphingomonadales bacterium]|nr:chloride channel protein [Sphingomonadales bacterium]
MPALNLASVARLRARIAPLAGAVALGIAAILFARGGEIAQFLFLQLVHRWRWAPLVLTPLLFAAVTHATRCLWPAARGSGIPQVMAAQHNPAAAARSPLVSLPTAAAKAIGTLLILLAGGSAGREGPTVQISAAIMVAMQRWFRVPVTAGIIIAGGAAGVAAAFNTPLAGVAFAIEELAAAFEQKVAVSVMATVMAAGLVSLGLSGDYVYFGIMNTPLPTPAMLIVAPAAGVTGGLCGGLFSRVLVAFAGAGEGAGVTGWLRSHPLLFSGGCGLVVAATGIATGGLTWGTGYDTTRLLLAGRHASLLLGPGKFLATLATAVSGTPGGIFAPSLSVGAGLGQSLGALFPSSPSGAIVLLGMAGYFTGVVRAPLTSVIIMMEMTADRTMILPLFATAIIADAVSALVCRDKLYHALAQQFA